MEAFPMRKRTSPVSTSEKEFYIRRCPEYIDDINNGKFFENEADIPAHYKLEERLKKDLLQKSDLEKTYKFVETKRGIEFANKLREENKNDDAYELKKGQPWPVIMNKFLKYVDELNSIYKKYSPCKKGCSSCCDMPVAISDLETIIIKEFLDENSIEYNQLNPMNTKRKNGENKEGLVGKEHSGIKCPFLIDNNCSIYPARPFVCRKYIVIGICNMEQENKFVDEGYIIGMTYDWIVSEYMRKNIKRYIPILDPMQIKITEEANLHGIHNLLAWQKLSDIRDNFSDVYFK